MPKTPHSMFVPFGNMGIREMGDQLIVMRIMQEMAMGVDRYARTPQPVRTIEPREGSVLSRFVEPSMDRHQAREHLSRQGPRLGEGIATWAYKVKVAVPHKFEQGVVSVAELDAACNGVRHSEDRCLRISAPEKGSRAVVEIAMKHQDDPWAPKVFDVMELRNGDWASEMELLQGGGLFDPRFDQLYKTPWFKGSQYSSNLTPTLQLMSVSPFVYELYRLIKEKQYAWDLHRMNIMFRGDQPVLLDPIYGG